MAFRVQTKICVVEYTLKEEKKLARLHTEGRWIKDQFGNVVWLKGVHESQWFTDSSVPMSKDINLEENFKARWRFFSSLGANFVRFGLARDLWHSYPDTFQPDLD